MKIKLCGLRRAEDIQQANRLMPDYVGFVCYPPSRRYVSPAEIWELKKLLNPAIQAVGVFVDEPPEAVAKLLNEGILDIAQLHGQEDAAYIEALRGLTDRPLIQAFRIHSEADLAAAESSPADWILLDSGMGSGQVFDWQLLQHAKRPYFLAGGLSPDNVTEAVTRLRPFGVDVSSGIETNNWKDPDKMRAFVENARHAEGDEACRSAATESRN